MTQYTPTYYEYKSFNDKLEDKELNELGADGWKLVSHTAIVYSGSLEQYYVFMRQIITPFEVMGERYGYD